MVSASNIPKYLYFSLSSSILLLPGFGSCIWYVVCTHDIFPMSNSIPINWLYILIVFQIVLFFLIFGNILISSMYISITQLPWWLIVLIISLSGLVGPRVFLLTVKLAKIFERKWKLNRKFQVSTQATNTGRPNVNKIDSCLVTGLIGEKNCGLRHVWDDLVNWDYTTDILYLDI